MSFVPDMRRSEARLPSICLVFTVLAKLCWDIHSTLVKSGGRETVRIKAGMVKFPQSVLDQVTMTKVSGQSRAISVETGFTPILHNSPVACPEMACSLRGFHSSTATVGLTGYKSFNYPYTAHNNYADNTTPTLKQITYLA